MRKIPQKELDLILEKHQKWLNNEEGGERADLRGANFCGIDLSGVDLRHAILSDTDFSGANFCEANLRFVDFRWANLSNANFCKASFSHASCISANLDGANFSDAYLMESHFALANLQNSIFAGADLRQSNFCDSDLRHANLTKTNLYHADLRGADLRNADMSNAVLVWANLNDAKLEGTIIPEYPYACPKTGSFVGYTVAENGNENVVVELQIPENARRTSGITNECRSDKAKVLSITSPDGSQSYDTANIYRSDFVYVVGDTIETDNYDENRWETTTGIHFFVSRDEAVSYYA